MFEAIKLNIKFYGHIGFAHVVLLSWNGSHEHGHEKSWNFKLHFPGLEKPWNLGKMAEVMEKSSMGSNILVQIFQTVSKLETFSLPLHKNMPPKGRVFSIS